MMGLPCGEEIMIVGRTMWTQSTSVTDRQTDKITITDTVHRIASHGKNYTLMNLRNRKIVQYALRQLDPKVDVEGAKPHRRKRKPAQLKAFSFTEYQLITKLIIMDNKYIA